MVKKEKDNPSGSNGQLEAVLNAITDLNERIDYIENKKDAKGQATLLIADRMFNTDRKHLPEMANNSLRTIRPLADSDTAGSVLNPEVQSGKTTMAETWKESYYRHMRGLKGNLMGLAKELALEQTRSAENDNYGDEAALGKGL